MLQQRCFRCEEEHDVMMKMELLNFAALECTTQERSFLSLSSTPSPLFFYSVKRKRKYGTRLKSNTMLGDDGGGYCSDDSTLSGE